MSFRPQLRQLHGLRCTAVNEIDIKIYGDSEQSLSPFVLARIKYDNKLSFVGFEIPLC